MWEEKGPKRRGEGMKWGGKGGDDGRGIVEMKRRDRKDGIQDGKLTQ